MPSREREGERERAQKQKAKKVERQRRAGFRPSAFVRGLSFDSRSLEERNRGESRNFTRNKKTMKRPRPEPGRDRSRERDGPSPMLASLLSPRVDLVELGLGTKARRRSSGFVKMRQKLRTPYSAAAPPLSDLLSLRLMESAADVLRREKERIKAERLRLEKFMQREASQALPPHASAREVAYSKLRKIQAEATIEAYRDLADEESSWLSQKALSHIPGFAGGKLVTPSKEVGKPTAFGGNPDEAAPYFATDGDVRALSAAVKSAIRRLRGLGSNNKKSRNADIAFCCLDILDRVGPLLANPLRDGVGESARALRQATYCDLNTVAFFQRMVRLEGGEESGEESQEGRGEGDDGTKGSSGDSGGGEAEQKSKDTVERMLYSSCRDKTLRVLENIEAGVVQYSKKVREERAAVNAGKSALRTLKAEISHDREVLMRSEHQTKVLSREREELISGIAKLKRDVVVLKE